MIKLTPRETSILTYIASSHGLSAPEYRQLFADLSPSAREIAAAIFLLKHQRNLAKAKPSRQAQETASALLAWT